MPLGVVVWIDDRPDRVAIYIDAEEITECGARFLQRALSANTRQGHWHREVHRLMAAL
jgi:hypothetical protein